MSHFNLRATLKLKFFVFHVRTPSRKIRKKRASHTNQQMKNEKHAAVVIDVRNHLIFEGKEGGLFWWAGIFFHVPQRVRFFFDTKHRSPVAAAFFLRVLGLQEIIFQPPPPPKDEMVGP